MRICSHLRLGSVPYKSKQTGNERHPGFAARVRTGYYGYGDQVKVHSVTDALAAISTTFELAGQPSPLYKDHNVYNLPIKRCMEGMRKQDPPPVPQLAVPITVVSNIFTAAYAQQTTEKLRAIADLIIIAFYFLLRVGEYTRPRTTKVNEKEQRATRTQHQFQVDNVGFFKNCIVLPQNAPLADLLEDSVTMRITKQ